MLVGEDDPQVLLRFTADLVLAHPKLAALRGFETVAPHDASVMAELWWLDPEQDVLRVLGDI